MVVKAMVMVVAMVLVVFCRDARADVSNDTGAASGDEGEVHSRGCW